MDAVAVQQLQDWDHQYVVHPQYVPTPESRPTLIVRGRGTRVYDGAGREYLDATGGLWLAQIGHGRPELAEAARAQIERLEYFPSFWDFTNEPAARLSKRLIDLAPEGLEGVYFTTGGAESNEIAIMLARLFHARTGHRERTVILSRRKGYHGVTYGARAATGLDVYHEEIGPLPGDFVHLTAPEPYRVPNCTDVCVAELEATIAKVGADRIAAMIGEPIMGVGGMIVPPVDYWPRIQAVLRANGILLIFDEVVTAFGRTGRWFAAEHWEVTPDIISTAKGLTSGYLPLGAVLMSGPIRDTANAAPGFVSGFTYTGHPTCCAVALRNLDLIEAEGLLKRAQTTGAYLLDRFAGLLEHPLVGNVRGAGLMLAVELVADKTTKEPAVALGTNLGNRFMSETGVIVRNIDNNLIFSPPLIFTREECDLVVDAVATMLDKYGDVAGPSFLSTDSLAQPANRAAGA